MSDSEHDQLENGGEEEGQSTRRRAGGPNLWLLLIAGGVLIALFLATQGPRRTKISYAMFKEYARRGEVEKVEVGEKRAVGEFKEAPTKIERKSVDGELKWVEVENEKKEGEMVKLTKHFAFDLQPNRSDSEIEAFESLLDEKVPNRSTLQDDDDPRTWLLLLSILVPVGLFIFLLYMFRRARDQMMGGGFLNSFTRSPAKKFSAEKQHNTFDDVAGLESTKADLQEIIEFLKEPEKFQRLGGHVPKGVLLLGPPGTGKTLLARAVAGEAGVPFYSVNGSEFIQMFVGVGASRVRDLFQTAKKNSPAIVFIDEIDAVGRQRGAGLGGGHDEREQTLNQILGEMDGFAQGETVIVIAATNRPDVLDPALLRPGRFDRHIHVDKPTKKGREAIFQVHVRDVPLAADVDLERLAAGTIGMTGADIRNIVNEAALWAARHNKKAVEMEDFAHARDKVLMGPRREEALIGDEKFRTAVHEAGHALVAWLVPSVDRVNKVTVIPRGRALGVTETLPEEERMNLSEQELRDRLAFALGGREAERIEFNEYSVGAQNDLERATKLARLMVTQFGMSERLGPVSYKLESEDPFLGREMHAQRLFSEHTLQIIDEEVARILHEASERARSLLQENKDKLDALAGGLMEDEELDEKEITELIGPSAQQLRDEAAAAAREESETPQPA